MRSRLKASATLDLDNRNSGLPFDFRDSLACGPLKNVHEFVKQVGICLIKHQELF